MKKQKNEYRELVSIIIPLHNAMNTLRRAVESIEQQKLSSYEIVIIDDGSTDASAELIEQLSNEFPSISSFFTENKGIAAARNLGLEKARGEFIAFLDSDDFYIDCVFANALSKIRENDIDIVCFGFRKGLETNFQEFRRSNLETNDSRVMMEQLFLEKSVDFYLWNKIYRKKVFNNVVFPEGKLYEDIIPSYNCMKYSRNTFFMDAVGYFYKKNSKSIVSQKFNAQQYDNILERIRLLYAIKKDFPELEFLAFQKLVDGYLSTGFKISNSLINKENEFVCKEYYKRTRIEIEMLRNDILFKSTPLSKKIGLSIYTFNHILFYNLYKIMLKK